jgi:hypothetical protein
VTINSPGATTTTLTRTGDGLVTLTATITVCGNNYTATSSAVTVGSPAATDLNKGPATSSDMEIFFPGVPGATSYNWLMNGTPMANQHSTECDMFPVSCNQTILACVAAVNACGTSAFFCKSFKNSPCIGGFSTFVVSPNPASSRINVTVNPDADESAKTNTAGAVKRSFNEIRLYDQQSTLKKRMAFKNASQASVDVSTLPVGTYFIEIINGTYIERKLVMIRK